MALSRRRKPDSGSPRTGEYIPLEVDTSQIQGPDTELQETSREVSLFRRRRKWGGFSASLVLTAAAAAVVLLLVANRPSKPKVHKVQAHDKAPHAYLEHPHPQGDDSDPHGRWSEDDEEGKGLGSRRASEAGVSEPQGESDLGEEEGRPTGVPSGTAAAGEGLGQGDLPGYVVPTSLADPASMQMFQHVLLFGGNMEIRRSTSANAEEEGESMANFVVTAFPDPWLTPQEVLAGPTGKWRQDLALTLADHIDAAVESLLEGPYDEEPNPVKALKVEGYGTLYVQRMSARQPMPPHGTPEDAAAYTTRAFRREVSVQTLDEVAELFESAILTGREVVVCHLPHADLAICVNQPRRTDAALPFSAANVVDWPAFKTMLKQIITTISDAAQYSPISLATLPMMDGSGVPEPTLFTIFGKFI